MCARSECHDSVEQSDCSWRRDGKQIFKAGNTYTVKWTSRNNYDIKVKIMEHDAGITDGADDFCMELVPSRWSRSAETMSLEFVMPDLLDLECADGDGVGGTSGLCAALTSCFPSFACPCASL